MVELPTMMKKRGLIKKLNGLVRKAWVPRYLHHMGPKKYTAWMHLKCVFLKEKLKDYSWRTLVEDHLPYYFPGRQIPHFTTLQKFSKRMPMRFLKQILRWSAQVDEVEVGAIDGTGFSRTKASSYYVKRIDRDNPIQRHVQTIIYTDCRQKKILAIKINAKPAGETKAVAYLTRNAPAIAETNIMDKAYDSQQVHEHFRNKGTYTIIPA